MLTRDELVRILKATRNGWMASFLTTSHHIARAVVDGRISENWISAYPLASVPIDNQARDLAHAAGLPFYPQTDDLACDAEDVWIAVDILCATVTGVCGVYSTEGWSFHPDIIEPHTVAEISASLRHHAPTITEAARLITEADIS